MKLSYWITLILVSILMIFIVQNAAATTVKVLFWTFDVSMALLLFFIFLLGFVTGIMWADKKRKKSSIKEEKPDEAVVASVEVKDNEGVS